MSKQKEKIKSKKAFKSQISWKVFCILLVFITSFFIYSKSSAATIWKKILFDKQPLQINDRAISSMAVFENRIYMGTYGSVPAGIPDVNCPAGTGAHIMRQKIAGIFNFSLHIESIFPAFANNCEVSVLKEYRGYLYAGTWNESAGAEIYRSSSGDQGTWSWTVPGGLNNVNNVKITAMETHTVGGLNYLYIGTGNSVNGTEIWRCEGGFGCGSWPGNWQQVNAAIGSGFGSLNNKVATSIKSFNNQLYVSTNNTTSGTQVWRCTSCDNSAGDWVQVNTNGFSGSNVNYNSRLEVASGTLLAGTSNLSGLQLWYLRSLPDTWLQVGISAGFGDSFNIQSRSIYSYSYKGNQRLVIGTGNSNGAQIWESETPHIASSWTSNNSVKANELINGADSSAQAVFSLVAAGQNNDNHLYAGTAKSTDFPTIWKRNWKPQVSLSMPSQETNGSGKVSVNMEDVDDYDGDALQAKVGYSINGPPCTNDATLSDSEINVSPADFSLAVNNSNEYQISGITTNANGSDYNLGLKWLSKTDVPSANNATNSCARATVFDSFYTIGGATESTYYTEQGLFTVDNIAPHTPTVSCGASPTKTTPHAVSGIKDSDASINFTGGTGSCQNSVNGDSTKWQCSLNLLEGNNSFQFSAVDGVGNTSAGSASCPIILDQTDPSCSVSPDEGTYAGQIDVKIEADDALDPDPYIYYTTNGSTPTISSSKAKDKKEFTFEDDTTLKYFCQDWVENKTSVKTKIYHIIPPQVELTKTAATSSGAISPILSVQPRDILLPTPKKSLQNIAATLFIVKDFLISQTERFNLSVDFLYNFLRILSAIIFGLVLFYLILVFDAELKKRKSEKVFGIMRKKYGGFAYALPIILAVFISLQLLFGFSLIAENEKVKPNDVITYVLSYHNKEKKKASNVVIYDALPSYVDYVDGGALKNGKVEFNVGDLANYASGSAQFRVKVKSDAPNLGIISNIAEGIYNENIKFESSLVQHEVEAQGIISGYIFYDSNADKIKGSGESGISGAEIKLYRDSDQDKKFDKAKDYLSKIINSSGNGYYEFSNVSAGTYFVESVNPGSNYRLTNSSSYQLVKLNTSLEQVSGVNFGYLVISGGPSPITSSQPSASVTPIISQTVTPIITLIESPVISPFMTISPSPTPITKKITGIVKKTTEKITKGVKKIQGTIQKILPDIIQKPIIKSTTKNVASPFLALIPILNLLFAFPSSVSWQFLRYLIQIFTEPFLYFGKGARRNWGVIYDSLTKQPVDLATVRLYDKASKRLLESKVTDFEGRYIFIVDLGKEYYLEVKKQGYIFPSKILARGKRDPNYDNLYHGEIIATGPISDIRKKEQGIITFNIPLDPKPGVIQNPYLPHKPIFAKIKSVADFEKTSASQRKREDQKILLALTLRKFNYFIGFLGPILALISFLIIPSWFTFIFIIFHSILLAMFLKLTKGKKVLPWGKTFELKTKEGLRGAVVRLFDEKYGRLLSVAVTKSGGRYGFLAGKESYIIIPYKQNFEFPDEKIKIKPTRERFVKEDLGMEKSSRSES